MVERVTSNDEVAGSIPSEGIHVTLHLLNFLELWLRIAGNFCAGLFASEVVFLPSSLFTGRLC